jgi:delta-aminolevulinic acid dehydratase/porphobilinogen synthase
MKRFIAFALCAILAVCAFTIVASAEEMLPEAVEPEAPAEEEPTVTESVVDYVKSHIEEISVIATLILTAFYNVRKHGVLNQSIGALNSNAIAVAENSDASIQNALAEIGRVGATVLGYSAKIEEFLEAFRENAEGKEKLEGLLAKVDGFLETAKLANVELANEVAELLVLANIPNSKKDELYARHLAAVNAIADAEHTEVIHHDGEEA